MAKMRPKSPLRRAFWRPKSSKNHSKSSKNTHFASVFTAKLAPEAGPGARGRARGPGGRGRARGGRGRRAGARARARAPGGKIPVPGGKFCAKCENHTFPEGISHQKHENRKNTVFTHDFWHNFGKKRPPDGQNHRIWGAYA